MCKPKPGARCAGHIRNDRDTLHARLSAATTLSEATDLTRSLTRASLDWWGTREGKRELRVLADAGEDVTARQRSASVLRTLRGAGSRLCDQTPERHRPAVAAVIEEEAYLHAEREFELAQPTPNPKLLAETEAALSQTTGAREALCEVFQLNTVEFDTTRPATRCPRCQQWAAVGTSHTCPTTNPTPAPVAAPSASAGPAEADGSEPDLSYRMEHQAPCADEDYRPGHLLHEIFAPDVWDKPQRYDGADAETRAQMKLMRDNPDAMVTMYRAVPPGITRINKGDWVTLSRDYAVRESYGMLPGDGDDPERDGVVLSYQVPARDLWSDGNSLGEFGYDGPHHIDTAAPKPAQQPPQTPAAAQQTQTVQWDRGSRHSPTEARTLGKLIEAQHGVSLYLRGGKSDDDPIVVSEIRVPEDQRGKGVGQAAMADLLAEADRNGWTVALSPDGAFGSSKTRLTAWYKKLGFVPNKGRAKDYRVNETMIRKPQQ